MFQNTTAFEACCLLFALSRSWVLLSPEISNQDVAFFVFLAGLAVSARKVRDPGSHDEIKVLKDELAGLRASQSEFKDKLGVIDLRLGMTRHGS
jgi:hypothetical protein